ncbi:MAG: aldo/keto reductase [Actinomycetota bacterium]|nr:aldo/keto reductase [Actinomycetota bacterium]
MPFFPLAIGDLARDGSLVETVATALDVTPSQVALAWLLHRAPNVIPIPGTTSLTHLEENLGASDVTLSEAQFQRVTDSSRAAVANK